MAIEQLLLPLSHHEAQTVTDVFRQLASANFFTRAMATALHVAGDTVDLDDFCMPERTKYVSCQKINGNNQACSSQANAYTACKHHLYGLSLLFYIERAYS